MNHYKLINQYFLYFMDAILAGEDPNMKFIHAVADVDVRENAVDS